MIDILINILEENEYKLIENTKEYRFLRNNSENKEDYYLVYSLGNYESIERLNEKIKQSEIVFDKMRKYGADVQKNTTALYLLQTNKKNETSDPLWHKICQIEELVTYMKRNVLFYTPDEQAEIKKIKGNYTNEISTYLSLSDNFTKFKEDKDLKYAILSKIFIKMHCLKYNFNLNEFPDLEREINELIKDNKYGTNSEFLFKSTDKINKIQDEEQKIIETDKLIDEYIQRVKNSVNIDIKLIEDEINNEIAKVGTEK